MNILTHFQPYGNKGKILKILIERGANLELANAVSNSLEFWTNVLLITFPYA
jgi:hypothetical protein